MIDGTIPSGDENGTIPQAHVLLITAFTGCGSMRRMQIPDVFVPTPTSMPDWRPGGRGIVAPLPTRSQIQAGRHRSHLKKYPASWAGGFG
jgi:hypothetical protein